MKTLRLLSVLLLLACPGATARAEDLPLCACSGKSFERRFADADAVFTGTVRDVASAKYITQPTRGRWGRKLPEADEAIIVTLDVDTAYKGAKKEKPFQLHTSFTHYTCNGYPFKKGQGYLVYAYLHDASRSDRPSLYDYPVGTYDVAGLCGGTREIEKAGDEMKQLEALKAAPPAVKPDAK